ncbi:NAD(P)H-binding protein [Novosphingobium sp. FGD1]|jgi:uncharacterized protein YbjT (DUF2867 family)|uniref:NAD(P)H-binding protein n=1 Tax=Novosphingobium silvae TaxID=2692619 RepID=A0A7X4GEF0_9SPHN|nr:NAD(P)H-binding protein [Novosphingobium silvae]MYL96875.1 NAD(P)H-binding protein [Novosphingobium silvae]
MTQQGALRICLVGATGLVGSAIISEAVGRTDVRIIGVGRREADLPPGARMEMLVGEPIDWPALIRAARADVFVCALGTTMKAAGSREQFRAIDHELVRFAAEGAREAGIERMVLVSSIGADRDAANFYLRVKGETEDALARLGFSRLDILRPALLRGTRKDRRPLERAAQWLAPLADLLVLHGPWRRFRTIRARDLARAAISLASETREGRFVHEHDALRELAQGRGVSPHSLGGCRDAPVDSSPVLNQGYGTR